MVFVFMISENALNLFNSMSFRNLKYILPLLPLFPSLAFAGEELKARAEINWRYGSERSILMSEFWVPVAQDADSVFYGDLRMMGDDQSNREGNLGVGYRKITQAPVLGKGVIGGNAWIDRRLTALGSTLHQTTIGGEWFGDEYDIRINGYIPLSNEEFHVVPNPDAGPARLVGSQIIVDTNGIAREEPQAGFDMELGWSVPFLQEHTDSFRVYAGGFHFAGDQSEDVTGWRVRALADVTSDVQIGGRFQSDDERGSQGFLEATVRFPLGHKKSYRKEGLRARLDESPERDIDIVTGTATVDSGQSKVVLNAATGTPQEILHVDNTAAGGGDGSVETPFDTLANAAAASSAQGIIYVHTGDGANTNQDQGITLNKAGQQLIGAGSNFVYDAGRFTTDIGQDATNTLIIAASAAPVITNVNATSDGITVNANNIIVAGVTIDGATRDGILIEADGGAASAQNITISNVTAINNRHGIYIHGANGGAISTMVQGAVTMTNSQHGIAVYDDTSGTFNADLGGGAMGSTGGNVLAGNTLEDLAVELDGGTLQAQNNWWGQAAGPDQDNPGIGIRPQIYYGAPINDGLAGHWTFDSEWTDNTTAYDRSGNTNDGALNGGLALADQVTGQVGEALDFDGVGDFVEVPDSATLRPGAGSSWTIVAWARPPNVNQRTTILSKRQDGGDFEQYGMTIADDASSGVLGKRLTAVYRTNIGTDRLYDTTTNVADDSWHHLIAVADQPASIIRLYSDTVELATDSTNSSGGWPTVNNPDPLRIGSHNGLGNFFQNEIDDVRVYNRALSAPEIAELYRMDASSTVNTSGFLGVAP